ncbi:hypothetical protein ABPG74_016244 [Tetrahymena malaccensis]
MKAVILNIQKHIEANSVIKAELVSLILDIFEKKYKNYIYLECHSIQAETFFLKAFNAETLQNVYLKFSFQNQILDNFKEQKNEIILNLIKLNQGEENIQIKDYLFDVLIEETIDCENYTDRFQRINAEKKTYYSTEILNETQYVRQVTAVYQRRVFNMEIIINELNIIENHPYLKKLDLNLNNNLFLQGEGALLGSWISKFSYLENLKLDIDTCQMKTDDLIELLNEISKCSYLKKLDLTFRINQIQFIYNEMGTCFGRLHLLECLSINQSLNQQTQPFGDYSLFGQGLSNCKNLRKLYLDASFSQTQNGSLQHLSLGLNNLKSIQKLHINLMQNNLTSDSLIGILQEISDCQQIEDLSLNLLNNEIQEGSLLKLFQAISKLQLLKKLSLDLINGIVDQNQLIGFGETLSQCSLLSYLDLTSQSFIQNVQDTLFEVLGYEISKIKSIKTLKISFNHNNSIDVQNVCKYIDLLENLEDFSMILNQASLSQEKMSGLDKLFAKIKNLKKLSILGICEENYDSNKELFGQYLFNCPNLSDLALQIRGPHQNYFVDTLNVISNIQTLKRLSFKYSSQVTEQNERPQLIGGCLSRFNKLKQLHLCLSQNRYNDEFVANIAKGLSDLKELNELKFEIWFTVLSDKGAQILIKQIQKLQKLYTIHIDLRYNKITDSKTLKNILLKSPYLVNKVSYI